MRRPRAVRPRYSPESGRRWPPTFFWAGRAAARLLLTRSPALSSLIVTTQPWPAGCEQEYYLRTRPRLHFRAAANRLALARPRLFPPGRRVNETLDGHQDIYTKRPEKHFGMGQEKQARFGAAATRALATHLTAPVLFDIYGNVAFIITPFGLRSKAMPGVGPLPCKCSMRVGRIHWWVAVLTSFNSQSP